MYFCRFLLGHCIVWPLIYVFWLPHWHLQTFLSEEIDYFTSTKESPILLQWRNQWHYFNEGIDEFTSTKDSVFYFNKGSPMLLQRNNRPGIDDFTSMKVSTILLQWRNRWHYFNEGIDKGSTILLQWRDRRFYFNEETDDFTSMKGLIIFL